MSKLPVLSGKKLINIFQDIGFIIIRQKGSHVTLQKITSERTYNVIIPLHTTLQKGTLLNILKQAEISKDELLDMLK